MLCGREVMGFALLSPSYFPVPVRAGGTPTLLSPQAGEGFGMEAIGNSRAGYFFAIARSAFDGVSFSGWTIVLLTTLRAAPRVGNSVSAPSRCRT
jgi:hypothetical protein